MPENSPWIQAWAWMGMSALNPYDAIKASVWVRFIVDHSGETSKKEKQYENRVRERYLTIIFPIVLG
jgi:hypothetical protein